MLVLSRTKNERIILVDPRLVDENGNIQPIVLTVVEVRGDRARIGIGASPQTAVHREEVYQAILREKPELNLPAVPTHKPKSQ